MHSRDVEIEDGVVRILREHIQPERVILFGSRAKNRARNGSDFDFAVVGSIPDITVQRMIDEKIQALAGLYTVDIIYMDDTDDEFREIVNQTGRVIYDKRRV